MNQVVQLSEILPSAPTASSHSHTLPDDSLPAATEITYLLTPRPQIRILEHRPHTILKTIGTLLVGLAAAEAAAAVFFVPPQFQEALSFSATLTAAIGAGCACTYLICPPTPTRPASISTEDLESNTNYRSASPTTPDSY